VARQRRRIRATRCERECRIAASLDHPNLRFIEGTDLRALLRSEGPLEPRRAVGMIEQVAGALDEAHAAGLVHRDVKPANILIRRRGQLEHAYLTDFGISKHRSAGAG
jgi:serine/threonine-protein kinase